MAIPLLLVTGVAAGGAILARKLDKQSKKPPPNSEQILVETQRPPQQGVSAMLWVNESPHYVKVAAVVGVAFYLANRK